jgi:hypothetical protein
MLKELAAMYLSLVTVVAAAQNDSGTAPVYQAAVSNALAVYHQFRGVESNLYMGLAVEQNNLSGNMNPYFGNGEWNSGSVHYEGVRYDHVLLKYNLVRDELVVLNPNTRNAFYLFKPRVESFTLGTRNFVNLRRKDHRSAPDTGYYERLAEGSITLLRKHVKSYQEKFGNANIEKRFDEKSSFYAVKDGVYYRLSKVKSLFALTGSLEGQIKDQLKNDRIELKSFTEATLTAITRYYNQINK